MSHTGHRSELSEPYPFRRAEGRFSRAGMTLVEVMIACMALGLTLSAFLTGFVASQKTACYANNRFESLNVARAGLETLTSLTYYDPALTVGAHSFSSNSTYVVSESNDVKDITFSVHWIDPTRARTSTLSIATSFSRAIHK